MIMIMVARRWATVAVVGRLSDFVRFGRLLMPSGDGRPATVRRRWRSVVAGTFRNAVLASGVCAAGAQSAHCADGPAFAFRPLATFLLVCEKRRKRMRMVMLITLRMISVLQ